jgi:hypothetical protein
VLKPGTAINRRNFSGINIKFVLVYRALAAQEYTYLESSSCEKDLTFLINSSSG